MTRAAWPPPLDVHAMDCGCSACTPYVPADRRAPGLFRPAAVAGAVILIAAGLARLAL